MLRAATPKSTAPPRVPRRPRSRGGFTLVELMIVLVLLAIVTAFAVPSFTSTINNNRLSALGNDLAAALQTARMEAVRRGQRVVVCPTSDGSSCAGGAQWAGWLAFADADGNGNPAAAEIQRTELVRAPMELWVSPAISGTGNRIVFRPDGFAYTNAGVLLAANLSACLETDRPAENVRDVAISAGGRVAVSRRDAAAACAAPPNP